MTTTPPVPAKRTGYHHGNLVEALLEAAIALIDEKGVDALSVREVARKAGVSPGAPFRHFSNRTALLTAVAEQAMARLTAAVRAEVEAVGDADPVEALRAIGRGRREGRLRDDVPVDDLIFAARAFVYGVARMWIDGHFREWKIEKDPPDAMEGALNLFIAVIGARL